MRWRCKQYSVFYLVLVFLFPWHFPVSWFVFYLLSTAVASAAAAETFCSAQMQKIRTRKTVFVVLKNVKNSRFVCLPKDINAVKMRQFCFPFEYLTLEKKFFCLLQWNNAKSFPTISPFFSSFFFALDDKRCFLCSLANNCLLFQNTDNSWEKSTQNAMDKNMVTFYRNYHIIWFSLLWLNKCFIGPNRMPNDECAISRWTKDMVNFPLEIPFLGSLLSFCFS